MSDLHINYNRFGPPRFEKGAVDLIDNNDDETRINRLSSIRQRLTRRASPLDSSVRWHYAFELLGNNKLEEQLEREKMANCLRLSHEALQTTIDELVEGIKSTHTSLKAVPFPSEIFEKWGEWKPSKRRKKLQSAIPHIAVSLNGDIDVLLTEPNLKRRQKRRSEFAHTLLLPRINIPELAQGEFLPLFIHSRRHFPHSDFFFLHYRRACELWGLWPVMQVWTVGKVVEICQDGAWMPKVKDRQETLEIGNRVDSDLYPGIVVLALQIQLEELKAAEAMAKLFSPQPMKDREDDEIIVRTTIPKWTYTEMRNVVVSTYFWHHSFNPGWESLISLAKTQYSNAIQNLRALLEQPSYFTRTCEHYAGLAKYRKAPAVYSSKLKLAQYSPKDFDDIVVEVLTAAMGTCLEWREIVTLLKKEPVDKFLICMVLARIQQINLDEMIHLLATSGTASVEVENWALDTLHHTFNNGDKLLLYEWGNKSRILQTLEKSASFKNSPDACTLLELFGFSKLSHGSPLLPLPSIIDAIEQRLLKTTRTTDFGSAFFIPFEQLVALSTLLEPIQSRTPWSSISDHNGAVLNRDWERTFLRKKYSTFSMSKLVSHDLPGSLRFPRGPPNKEIIEQQRTSESILDNIWKSFEEHCQNEEFSAEHAVMENVRCDWNPKRTFPYKEPEKKTSCQEIISPQAYTFGSHPLNNTDFKLSDRKTKIKTRGEAQVDDTERPVQEVLIEPPLTLFTHAKHCEVFWQLFQCRGPVSWDAIKAAFASIKFEVAPSGKGSGWRFKPPPTIGNAPIFMHDTHKDEIYPKLVRVIGDQLHNLYGLTAESFRPRGDEV
jgi:hypothetical protein